MHIFFDYVIFGSQSHHIKIEFPALATSCEKKKAISVCLFSLPTLHGSDPATVRGLGNRAAPVFLWDCLIFLQTLTCAIRII